MRTAGWYVFQEAGAAKAMVDVIGFMHIIPGSEISPASQAAGVGFLLVALLAGLLSWYTYRSYKGTENWRLLFVFTAFVVFLLKSVLFVWNEFQEPHPIPHDVVLAVAAVFDLIVLLLLVIPFFARAGK